MRRPNTRHVGRAAPQIHLHIGRIVADAGVPGVDAPSLPASLEAALASRFDPRARQRDHASRRSTTTDAIADAIAARVGRIGHGGGGDA
jgi:hypothetical protein